MGTKKEFMQRVVPMMFNTIVSNKDLNKEAEQRHEKRQRKGLEMSSTDVQVDMGDINDVRIYMAYELSERIYKHVEKKDTI